jgi:hypothetical protein
MSTVLAWAGAPFPALFFGQDIVSDVFSLGPRVNLLMGLEARASAVSVLLRALIASSYQSRVQSCVTDS